MDKVSFNGEWLTFDASQGIHEWLTWRIAVTGNEILLNESSGRRRPAKGMIDGSSATVNFPGDRSYDAKLINDNIIEWDNNTGNHWFRKGSPESYDNVLGKKKEILETEGLIDEKHPEKKEVNLRILVNDWVQEIASDDPEKTGFIEETAEAMRSAASVVRYLVFQLSQEFHSNNHQENESKEAAENSDKLVTVKVHRRIARLLAEMSDIKYFEKGEEKARYKRVKEALKNHAIPVIVPRLPIEEDLELRKDFATTLGKLGEDESVDALVRAVVSDEKVRANRKEMLKEYYLDPSKKQSDDASDILKGAVDEAKKTLRLLQWLNVVVFIAGMIILVGGLYVSITNENARVAGALAGIGGFAGVIGLLINDPLNRIQNSLSNLVQLEAAFTSFIWELNLNSTYIQSQYVAEGILREEDVAETLNRMEGAMDFAMSQVATYTDEGREVIVPHLTHLSPMVGKTGDTVHIYGNRIKVIGKTNETTAQIAVAINHVPFKSIDPPEKKDVVSFELPTKMPAGFNSANGNVWISLVINGVETNALPFSVLGDNGHSESLEEINTAPTEK